MKIIRPQIIGYANNRVDWKIHVKDANGKLIETKEVLNEHTLRMKWTPNQISHPVRIIFLQMSQRRMDLK